MRGVIRCVHIMLMMGRGGWSSRLLINQRIHDVDDGRIEADCLTDGCTGWRCTAALGVLVQLDGDGARFVWWGGLGGKAWRGDVT